MEIRQARDTLQSMVERESFLVQLRRLRWVPTLTVEQDFLSHTYRFVLEVQDSRRRQDCLVARLEVPSDLLETRYSPDDVLFDVLNELCDNIVGVIEDRYVQLVFAGDPQRRFNVTSQWSNVLNYGSAPSTHIVSRPLPPPPAAPVPPKPLPWLRQARSDAAKVGATRVGGVVKKAVAINFRKRT